MRAIAFALGLVVLGSSFSVSFAATDSGAPLQAKGGGAKQKPLSDGQIKKILIGESIAAYSGNCPCPYSRARNGSSCGKRSAYSREGGEAPLCYPADVSAEMVKAYRAAQSEPE